MTWGYALVWAQQFLTRDEDPLVAKLKFLQEYGLQTTGISLKEWAGMEDARREKIASYLAEHDLGLTLGVHANWYADVDTLKQETEVLIDSLDRFGKSARAPICTTSGGGPHRFLTEPPLERQVEAMSHGMAPLAKKCAELGMPLALENHGDYYVSDIVQVVQATPELGIFLDTGNCFLIGEKPLAAAEEAAPYVLGTHFKDQTVAPRPNGSPLNFEVDVAITGQGHVPLREIYAVLKQRCPNFDRLAMQIELIPPDFSGDAPVRAVEQAVAFVRSLEG